MQVVLLSGGSGKRLWPLSNDVRSKQFISIFRKEDGSYESMIQRIYRNMLAVFPAEDITIATAKSQVSAVHNQLPGNIRICVEPERRDTFPAMALVASYLHEVCNISAEEVMVVVPVDPYVDQDYFDSLAKLGRRAAASRANMVLMGIAPTYPSEKYGYILPFEDSVTQEFMRVCEFKEKPDERNAAKYIHSGALWNSGVFAFRIDYLLNKAHQILDFTGYSDLYAHYADQPGISFDYAVVEREPLIEVMRFTGTWKDLGTWNTLTEAMSESVIGDGLLDSTSNNTHIINELPVPIIGLGLQNIIVAASPQGILVSDKFQSGNMKPYVEQLPQQVMMAQKSWGDFLVLYGDEHSMTIKVTIQPGESMNYHAHQHRDESWIIISGTGYAVVNDKIMEVKQGSRIYVPRGSKHLLAADTLLEVIEVQVGTYITVDDKQKETLNYVTLNIIKKRNICEV